ncbi:MAG: diguanylate cyclase [Planctomycetota bacterium]
MLPAPDTNSEKSRLLVVEDEPATLALLKCQLQKTGYEVMGCTNGREAVEILNRVGADVVITDWSMPEMNGIDLCRAIHELRETGVLWLVHVILLTAHNDKQHVVEAFEAGADDFLSKPYDLQELLARIRVGQRVLRLQSELLERQLELAKSNAQMTILNQKLGRLANTDALTSLPNRRHVLDRYADAWELAKRSNQPISCIMADVDHFKKVNDTYGHNTGDCVLREMAQRIQSQLRRYDLCGRFGGEEFLIICPGITADGAAVLAERIRLKIAARKVDANGTAIKVTMSFGVASTQSGYEDPEILTAQADKMLYAAKEHGRNQVWLKEAQQPGHKLESIDLSCS